MTQQTPPTRHFAVSEPLLVAIVNCLERMPATKDVRAVLNGIDQVPVLPQPDAASGATTMGGGGPGEEVPPKKPT